MTPERVALWMRHDPRAFTFTRAAAALGWWPALAVLPLGQLPLDARERTAAEHAAFAMMTPAERIDAFRAWLPELMPRWATANRASMMALARVGPEQLDPAGRSAPFQDWHEFILRCPEWLGHMTVAGPVSPYSRLDAITAPLRGWAPPSGHERSRDALSASGGGVV